MFWFVSLFSVGYVFLLWTACFFLICGSCNIVLSLREMGKSLCVWVLPIWCLPMCNSQKNARNRGFDELSKSQQREYGQSIKVLSGCCSCSLLFWGLCYHGGRYTCWCVCSDGLLVKYCCRCCCCCCCCCCLFCSVCALYFSRHPIEKRNPQKKAKHN